MIENPNTGPAILVRVISDVSSLLLLGGVFILARLLAVGEFGNYLMAIFLTVLIAPRIIYLITRSVFREKRTKIESGGDALLEAENYSEAIRQFITPSPASRDPHWLPASPIPVFLFPL